MLTDKEREHLVTEYRQIKDRMADLMIQEESLREEVTNLYQRKTEIKDKLHKDLDNQIEGKE